jgi:hypothetical protein
LLENQNDIIKFELISKIKKENQIGLSINKINYSFKHMRSHLCSFQAPFIKKFFYNKNSFSEYLKAIAHSLNSKKKYLIHIRAVKGGFLCFSGGLFGFLPKSQSMKLVTLKHRKKKIRNTLKLKNRLKTEISFYIDTFKNKIRKKAYELIKSYSSTHETKQISEIEIYNNIKSKLQIYAHLKKKKLQKIFAYLQKNNKKVEIKSTNKLNRFLFSQLVDWYQFKVIITKIKPSLRINKIRKKRGDKLNYRLKRLKRKNLVYKKYINNIFASDFKLYYFNKYKKRIIGRKKLKKNRYKKKPFLLKLK